MTATPSTEVEMPTPIRNKVLLRGEQSNGAVAIVVFARRSLRHTLANPTKTPAHYLLVITPAGFEREFLLDSDGYTRHSAGRKPRSAMAAR